jgi:hypothetical protein
LEARLRTVIAAVAEDAVVRVRVHGQIPEEARSAISAASLRAEAPPEMNLAVVAVENGPVGSARRSKRGASPVGSATGPMNQPSTVPAQGCLFA